MQVTLDSSIFIAALRKEELEHDSCFNILEKVKNGVYVAIEPYTVLIEVVAAIKRRTGSSELATNVKRFMESLDTVYFLELVRSRADKCAEICEKLSVKGMDSIVIQTAMENGAILVTLDKEMDGRARKIVKVAKPSEL